MKKTILALLISASLSVNAQVPSMQATDLSLPELAKITTENTKYNLIFPTGLDARINFFQGQNLKGLDFEEFLVNTLKIHGFSSEKKGNNIYVKKDVTTVLFDNKSLKTYKVIDGIDFKGMLPDDAKFSQFGNTFTVFTTPQVHAQIVDFIEQVNANTLKTVVRTYQPQGVSVDALMPFIAKGETLYSDPITKKIVYIATQERQKLFTDLIVQLDYLPKTYNVNFLIASVNKSELDERGLGFIFSSGGVSFDLLKSAVSFNSLTNALENFNFLASFIASQSSTQIFSRPFLQLKENTSSSFSVGKEIPFTTSTVDAATGQTIRNVERRNVGLSVNVTLQTTNQGGLILDLSQSLSSVSDYQLSGSADIVTDSQNLKTQLTVKPDLFYAVGGITDERTAKKNSGLPFFDTLNKTDSSQQSQIVIFVSLSSPTSQSVAINDFWWD